MQRRFALRLLVTVLMVKVAACGGEKDDVVFLQVPPSGVKTPTGPVVIGDDPPMRRLRLPEPGNLLTRPGALQFTRLDVTENSGGFYVELDCPREEVNKPKGQRRYQLQNCMLDAASAREKVEISPPVKYTLVGARDALRIHGDFERGTYTLKISAGATAEDGRRLLKDLTQKFEVPARSPSLEFLSMGRILPRGAWTRLPLRHLNVDRVQVEVRHVRPRNMLFWMSSNYKEADRRNSDLVHAGELALDALSDQPDVTWLNLRKMVRTPRLGLYEVKVSGAGERTTQRLLSTNLHLVAKRAEAVQEGWPPRIHVWALDTRSALPVQGVEVTLVRRSGHALARCATDRLGGCRLPVRQDIDPSPPFALVARQGEDLTYLPFRRATRREQAGEDLDSYLARAAYLGYAYTDRGIYRPGETVHLAAVIRDDADRAPKPALPMILTVHDPMGRPTLQRDVVTNAGGMVALDYTLGRSCKTGRYDARLTAGGNQVASAVFSVSAFVPERMRVSVKAEKAAFLTGEPVKARVKARYLFGGSAAGSAVEVTCRARRAPLRLAGYQFGGEDAHRQTATVDLGTVRAKLDAKGEAEFTCPGAADFRGLDRMAVTITAAVFEAGSGRSTVARAKAWLNPAAFHLGLKQRQVLARQGQRLRVEGVVLDWDRRPYRQLKQVEITYGYLINEVQRYQVQGSARAEHRRQQRVVPEGEQRVKVKGGRFSTTLPIRRDATHRVTVSAPGTRASLDIRSVGSWSWRYYRGEDMSRHSQGDATPGRVKIRVPPKPVDLKQQVEVSYEVPWPGRALLSLESHKVLKSEWRDVKPGVHRWSFKVEEYAPNVYATVLLVPSLQAQRQHPGRPLPRLAWGARMIKVNPRHLQARARLMLPAKVRPNRPLEVRLSLGRGKGPRYATIAAVDEGLLSLTGFSSPDPAPALFPPRALGVATHDTLGQAVRLDEGVSGPVGGGRGGLGGEKLPRPVKSVALYSGLLKVPPSGELVTRFNVPAFRGRLRIMAVAAGARRVASASAGVQVTEPLVLQATLPRFMVSGDTARVPVHITNMHDRDLAVRVSLSAHQLEQDPRAGGDVLASRQTLPAVSVSGLNKPLQIKKGGSATAMFTAKALRGPGKVRLVATARAGKLTSRAAHDLPVKHDGPTVTWTSLFKLGKGVTDISSHMADMRQEGMRSSVYATAVPFADALGKLDYLVQYPYGCLEQTTSSAMPLLAIGARWTRRLISRGPDRQLNVTDMVASGIARVLSMQTTDGGFAYWPGSEVDHYWGTTYATIFLQDAVAQGYQVPRQRLEDALDYLEHQLRHRASRRDVMYGAPFALYALARAGRDVKAEVNQLLELVPDSPVEEEAENAYLLMTAARLLGDKKYDQDLRQPELFAGSGSKRWSGVSFYADRRRNALVLSLFIDNFGAHKGGAGLLKQVTEELRQEEGTTQEISWAVRALGRWARAMDRDLPSMKLLTRDRSGSCKPRRVDSHGWFIGSGSACEGVRVEASEEAAGAHLVVTSTGIPKRETPWTTGEEGLTVRRHLLDLRGAPLDPKKLKLGDLAFMRVTLANRRHTRVQNIALVANLPACLEAELPHHSKGRRPSWIRPARLWEVDHTTVRDDRVVWFGDLNPRQMVTVYATVRATAAGKFTMPPVEAEAMYLPDEIWARQASSEVRVTGTL